MPPGTTFPRADPEAVARFERLFPQAPDVVLRPMFGHPAAFASGHMFLGVFAGEVFVRLSAADRPAGLRLPGAHAFEPMPGRPMREYVVLPPSVLADPAKARPWVDRALSYARSLPTGPGARRPTGRVARAGKPMRPVGRRAKSG